MNVYSSVSDPGGETIAAIATPPGRGALAVVRVSGPDTAQIAQRPDPAHIALAARTDAFDSPPRLGLDLAVHLVPLEVFFLPGFVAPGFERGKALVLSAHLPPLHGCGTVYIGFRALTSVAICLRSSSGIGIRPRSDR